MVNVNQVIMSRCQSRPKGLKGPWPPCEDELMWNVSEDHAPAKNDT